ncbi:MAG: hypothetical protein EXQ48_08715 [Acidobacteria bacterium]|nr:hypothetical protein [Acidobacteriota bacterium]
MRVGEPILLAALLLAAVAPVSAQRGGRAQGPPPTPKADAAIDITGTWVSVISEDWALRMVTPKKGDYTRVPMTPAARAIADSWDPAKDEAAKEQCKAYGAPGVMRQPGRLRISWQDDQTLKVELEAGNQTRVFHFNPAPSPAQPSWQGHSQAQWQYTLNPPRTGDLKIETTRLRAGYLRKNGIPYSANATMTEYYHRMTVPNGDVWLTIVSEITDPENLREPFVQSTHFKKLGAGAAFKPEPCSAR